MAVSAGLGRDVSRIAVEHLPTGRRAETRREPERLANDWTKLGELAVSMRPNNEFPATPSPLCRWCDYLVACPEGRASLRVDNTPEDDVPPIMDDEEF
jgi:hypothetical protein